MMELIELGKKRLNILTRILCIVVFHSQSRDTIKYILDEDEETVDYILNILINNVFVYSPIPDIIAIAPKGKEFIMYFGIGDEDHE